MSAHKLPLALLALLPALWFSPLLCGWLPDFMDTVTQIYPYRLAAARQLRQGLLPEWLPNQMAGMPLAANPQIAVWYPPNALLLLLPNALGYGMLLIFHSVWGGWGQYALLHGLTRRRFPAFFGAVGFQFGAAMISRLALPPHMVALAWVPWCLLGAEGIVRTRSWFPGRAVVLLAVAAGCQFLSGAPQITYYTGLGLAAFAGVRLLSVHRRRSGRALVLLATAALLALLLSAVQLLPTLELLKDVERGALAPEKLVGQGLTGPNVWRALVGGTAPVIEDTDSINAIGAGLLLLVPLAFVRRRHRKAAAALAACGILAYVLALGALVPFWSRTLPMFDHFHAPRRALLFWSVVGPALAGLGADAVLCGMTRRGWSLGVQVAALLVLLIPNAWMLPRLEREFTRPERLTPQQATLDAVGDRRFVTVDPTLNYSYGSRQPYYADSLMPNAATWFGLMDAQGYDPLVLRRFAMARDIACARSGVFYPSHGAFFTDPNSPVLRLLAVEYLVGRWDLFDPGRAIPGASMDREQLAESLELVVPHSYWPVFRFKEARPQAWAVAQVLTAPGAEQALLAALAAPTGMVAFVEAELPRLALHVPPAVNVQRVHPGKVVLSWSESPTNAAFVILSETYHRGWSARTVETGEVLEVLPTNGFLLGTLVPPGVNSIEMTYRAPGLRMGIALTLLGLALSSALFFLEPKKRHGGG